jgi:hypothetical protein
VTKETGQGEEDGIPQEVRAFIEEHINSIEQLEILLFLHRHHDRSWTAAELSRELYISEESAARRLEDFAARKLVVRVEKGHRYQSVPVTAPSYRVIGLLATAYQERRVRVVNLVFSKPVDHVRSFADAFKFRKKND